mgnify:CR=1 FL=1
MTHRNTLAAAILSLLVTPACGGDPDGAAVDADPNAPDADPNAPDADPSAPDGGGGGGADADTRRFSFFVTSLATMRLQSGSQDGFGGDLGGLAGADAIFTTAATAVGFGHKTWRAFLSVYNNGTPLHAIDRIGTGPWYDANERLVAMDLAGLTSGDRPAGDAASVIVSMTAPPTTWRWSVVVDPSTRAETALAAIGRSRRVARWARISLPRLLPPARMTDASPAAVSTSTPRSA